MSLQVWLPLNGDLHNQGLLNSPNKLILQDGNNFNNNGKIGKCLSSTTTNVAYFQDTSNNKLISLFNSGCIYTMAFWYKLTGNGTSGSIIQIGTTTPSSGSGNGTFGFWWTNNSNPRIVWNDGDNGKRVLDQNNDGSTLGTDYTNWHHLIAIIDKTTMSAEKQTFYIDGVKVKEATYNNSSANALTITNANNYIYFRPYYALLNDVRIYDHALSEKEVKDLSQGLVLHYQLNNNGIGRNNIFINTGFTQRYSQTSGWDTTKNGTLLASSWGGYNSGVGNQATVYHAHLKLFNNEYVYEYIKTSSENWLGISQGGLQTKLVAGKTYTFSWEEYHVEGANRVGTGLYYFQPNATSANFHLGIQQAADVTRVLGKWQKFSYTFIAPSDADYNKNMSWYIYGHYNGNGTFYMRHPKLEEGDGATNWYLAPTDPNYINNSIIYDSSGYNNNGISILDQIQLENINPRYVAATNFTGHIAIRSTLEKLGQFNFASNYTICAWVKRNMIEHTNYDSIFVGLIDFTANSNSSNKIGFSAGDRIGYYVKNTSSSTTNITYQNGEWVFMALVNNINTFSIYLNGALTNYKSVSHTLSMAPDNNVVFYIGSLPNGYGASQFSFSDNVLYSYAVDARLYMTALTVDQIMELYKTSKVVIDNIATPRSLE